MGGSFLSPCRAFSSLLKERSRELLLGSDPGFAKRGTFVLVVFLLAATRALRNGETLRSWFFFGSDPGLCKTGEVCARGFPWQRPRARALLAEMGGISV